jgi:hypothetical protein
MAQAIAEYVHPTKAVRVLRPKTFPTPVLFVADIVTSFSWISFDIHQQGRRSHLTNHRYGGRCIGGQLALAMKPVVGPQPLS